MDELPINIQRAIRKYEIIETDGFVLAPILVQEYEEFIIARPALEVMHQSLPVALMRMPLLSALYAMDYKAVSNGESATGLFSRALLILALSMRLGQGLELEKRIGLFNVVIDRENPAKLVRLQFFSETGEMKIIEPMQYTTLRKIIAAQNGVKLESDTANPDIVKAQKDMASAGMTNLDANIDDWISAIAALTGTEDAEIDEWPILKLQRRSDSFFRILSYLVCGIGEVNGTTWKSGNPTPHPFFARVNNGNGVLTEMGGSADGSQQSAPPKAATAIREITKNLTP